MCVKEDIILTENSFGNPNDRRFHVLVLMSIQIVLRVFLSFYLLFQGFEIGILQSRFSHTGELPSCNWIFLAAHSICLGV